MEVLRPNKTSFMFSSLLAPLLLSIVVSIGAITLLLFSLQWGYVLLLLVIPYLLFSVWYATIRYAKESYEVYDTYIIKKWGGLFSDYQVELLLPKVTHIRHIRPFLEYSLFRTGNIIIDSAGTSASQCYLVGLDASGSVYKRILALLQHNGFTLSKQTMLNRQKPVIRGIVLELIGTSIGGFVILFVFLFRAVEFRIFFLITLLFTVVLGLYIAVRFFDLQQRVYTVYADMIVYNEGFLTKVDACIPSENLSDTSVSQDFFQRIFGVYQVIASCKGTNQQILFSHIGNGPTMKKAIGQLIITTHEVPEIKKEKSSSVVAKQVSASGSEQMYKIQPLSHMLAHMWYVLIFLGVIVVFPLAFFMIIFFIIPFFKIIIEIFATTYTISSKRIEQTYSFIQTSQVAYALDKVTGIVISRTLIDRVCNTCTVHIWSIGASSALQLTHIAYTPQLVTQLRSFGYDATCTKTVKPTYSLLSFIQRHIILFPVLLIVGVIASLLLGWLVHPLGYATLGVLFGVLGLIHVYNIWYYTYASLEHAPTYMKCTKGLVVQKTYFVQYAHIKDCLSIQYPTTHQGTLVINVAGEVQSGQYTFSHVIDMPYLDQVRVYDDTMDVYLLGKKKKKKTLFTCQPDVRNSMVVVG
ncbi:MAG: PH domain-containing protein, partial [Candidatus Woesearchaeota archaeon]